MPVGGQLRRKRPLHKKLETKTQTPNKSSDSSKIEIVNTNKSETLDMNGHMHLLNSKTSYTLWGAILAD